MQRDVAAPVRFCRVRAEPSTRPMRCNGTLPCRCAFAASGRSPLRGQCDATGRCRAGALLPRQGGALYAANAMQRDVAVPVRFCRVRAEPSTRPMRCNGTLPCRCVLAILALRLDGPRLSPSSFIPPPLRGRIKVGGLSRLRPGNAPLHRMGRPGGSLGRHGPEGHA